MIEKLACRWDSATMARALRYASVRSVVVRFLKMLGLLLIFAAVCRLALFLVVGHSSTGTNNRYLSEIVGTLLIYVVAGIGAGIAALITRERYNDFPGLYTGLLTALVFTTMLYVNS